MVMRSMRGHISLLVVLSALVGCAAKRPPLQAPLASVDRSVFSGSALSGPTTRPVTVQNADDALIVSVELIALDAVPSILNPVAPDVRLIVATRSDGAIQSRSRLTRGIRWEAGGASPPATKARSTSFSHDELAVLPGACAVVNIVEKADSDHGFRILLNQSPAKPGELNLAIAVTGRVPAEEGSNQSASLPIDELAILKPVAITQPTTIALLIPFTFSKSEVRSVLAQMEVRRATESNEDARLIADASAQINRSLAMSATRPAVASQWGAALEVALRGLENPATRRASLLYLCRRSHAAICEDLALTASDEALENIAGIIRQRTSDPNVPHDDASLAWNLDAGALRFAADLQTKDQLPPELLTLLIRHTGQVGMNSGSVAEMLSAVKTREEFEARVVSENMIYLEDTSPAARVRAYDWLAARSKSPTGYDPLGPPREREAALEKLYESMATQASAKTGGRP